MNKPFIEFSPKNEPYFEKMYLYFENKFPPEFLVKNPQHNSPTSDSAAGHRGPNSPPGRESAPSRGDENKWHFWRVVGVCDVKHPAAIVPASSRGT